MATTRNHTFKILLIGDSAVGKSCIILRFSDNVFNSTYISTVGIDFRKRTVDIDGKKITLQIWDTAGQERYKTITSAYYRGAMGVMLVYDITNEQSFNSIERWIKNIEENAPANIEKMILGNKCDSSDSRVVNKERGQLLADEHGIKFMETSAKNCINMEEAFLAMAKNIKEKEEKSGGPLQPVTNGGLRPGQDKSSHKRRHRRCC